MEELAISLNHVTFGAAPEAAVQDARERAMSSILQLLKDGVNVQDIVHSSAHTCFAGMMSGWKAFVCAVSSLPL